MHGIKKQMEHYKAMGVQGSESIMHKSIDLIDEMILEPFEEAHEDMYWAFMRKFHELYMGNHYDKSFAEWEVEQMYHKGSDGKEYKGAHWTMSQVQVVYDNYKSMLKQKDNVYDMFVALNSFYHDNCVQYKQWFADKYEDHIIQGAINYFFQDGDAPEGKIWLYYKGMRNKNSY